MTDAQSDRRLTDARTGFDYFDIRACACGTRHLDTHRGVPTAETDEQYDRARPKGRGRIHGSFLPGLSNGPGLSAASDAFAKSARAARGDGLGLRPSSVSARRTPKFAGSIS